MKHQLWILNHYGGSPQHGMVFRSYHLAKALKAQGVETTLFSSAYSHVLHTPPQIQKSYQREILDGIQYIWVRNFSYTKSNSLGRVWNMLYMSLKLLVYPYFKQPRPDSILISSPSPFLFMNAWFWSKLTGAQLLFEVRDIWPLTLEEMSGLSRYHPLILWMRFLEKWAYKSSDWVVSVLPHADRHMIPSGLKPEKFVYIPNGVEIQKNAEAAQDADAAHHVELNARDGHFYMGYCGTLGIANNLDLLVEAAALLRDENIVFCLLGNGPLKGELQARVAELQLQNVEFYDAVPKSAVSQFLDSMDACFISLKDKALFRFGVSPNKLFDYMQAGKPILYCINSGNHPVTAAQCGLEIQEQSPQAVAKAVQQLKALSTEERQQMGQNAQHYVQAEHEYTQLSKKLYALLKAKSSEK